MIIQIILSLTIGIFFGTLTGLIPGLHINLIGSILISLSIFILPFTTPTNLIIFLVSMSITHTFIDFIPSIFLGAPDEDTALSILPGHELLKKGQGYKAIIYTSYGSLYALVIVIIFSIISILFLNKISNTITTITPYLLIISTLILIINERKLKAILVLILSGFLGIAVLNANISQPFLPLLSGLFGASSLIISLKNKTTIPKQKISKLKINKKSLIFPLLASAIASPFCTLLPGLGSGQAAIIGSSIIKPTKRNFLILLGATNTIVIGLSFIIFYTMNKTRTGVASTLSEIPKNINPNTITIILLTILIAGIIAFHWTILLGKIISKNINKINYSYISITTLIFLSTMVFFFTGIFGFFIFLISTSVGIYGILSGVRRTNLMGCLIIPIIIWYLI